MQTTGAKELTVLIYILCKKVAVDPNCGCKTCKFCLDGKYHFCRKNMAVGVKKDGGFARYCVGEFKILPFLEFQTTVHAPL